MSDDTGTATDRDVLWYGKQGGSVYLREGKLAVERPRLRRRGRGRGKEVVVPAYAALQNRAGMQERMLKILLNGVSPASIRKSFRVWRTGWG